MARCGQNFRIRFRAHLREYRRQNKCTHLQMYQFTMYPTKIKTDRLWFELGCRGWVHKRRDHKKYGK